MEVHSRGGMKSGQHEPIGGGEAVDRFLNINFSLLNREREKKREVDLSLCLFGICLRADMEGVDCVVSDVVCDDLAAEGNITSPLPSGDTFQVNNFCL